MKRKTNLCATALFAGSGLFTLTHAGEIVKLQNTNQLDNSASWSGGVVPGAADVMLWNSTYTTPGALASLAQIGSSLSVAGIKVTDVGGTRNAANTMVGYLNTSSGATLTIGAGGIDLSAATQAFMAQSKITIGADQEWKIGNANTAGNPMGMNNNEDLAFQAQLAGAAFDFGGKTVTTSGAGQVTITSGYTLANGNLNVANPLFVIQGGSSLNTTINSTVGIAVAAGSTLRLQSNSGPISSAAPVTVNGGTLAITSSNASKLVTQSGAITLNAGSTIASTPATTFSGSIYNLISGNLSLSGDIIWNHTGSVLASTDVTGGISGSGTITYQNTSSNAATLTRWNGNNSGYTGTVSVAGASGSRILRLNSSNAGSSSAAWSIATGNTLQINGVAPQLGTLTGAGVITNSHATSAATIHIGSGTFSGVISNGTPLMNVSKVGAGTLTLTGANTYTGATSVNQGKLYVASNTTGASAVTVADGATYGVSVISGNDDIPLASLTLGTTTGCTLAINNGTFADSTLAPVSVTGALLIQAPTGIDLSGSGFTVGAFPVVSFGSIGGTLGFAGLTLKLPPRVAGTLVDNTDIGTGTGTIGVNITAVEGIRWIGGINQDWDVDPVGDGATGTPNWKTTVTQVAARFLQGAGGTDAALFDDQAAGSGDVGVTLTTTVTPVAVHVSNATRNYTFAGAGSIAGTGNLVKDGAGTLTLANTAPNSYSGGTTISAGTLTLGDGMTPGAGSVQGPIANEGALILNRPDDHHFSNPLTGNGTLTKNQANTINVTTASTLTGGVEVTNGILKFHAGGTLSGVVSGSGKLEATGGTLTLSGTAANTVTGDTTVSGTGILRLQKDPGVTALAGNIYVTGTGNLVVANNDQIATTADLYILGSSSDPMVNSTGSVTVRNIFVNTTNGTTGQLILKNTFTATGTATLQSGIMGAGSGSTANLAGVVIASPTNTIFRVAGNSAATTLNIGGGGVTAAGGDWQIKFGTTNNDAVVNLGGNLTTTGDFTISNGNYTGINLNLINLTGPRTFDIGAGTTTTVAPDFGDLGDLIKAGAGKLVLNASCNLGHIGATRVTLGTLILNGTAPNNAPVVASGATLGGNGTITAAFTLPSGATVSPGDASSAQLNFGNNVTLDPGSTYAVGITAAATCDKLAAASSTLSANGAIVVTLTGYAPLANDTFDLADATTISGSPTFDFTAATLPAGLAWDTSGFTTDGTIKIKQLGYQAFAAAIPNPADRDPGDDPDSDGVNNLLEYVLGGDPVTASTAILPLPSLNAEGKLVLTFNRRDASEGDTTQTVEIGSDLSGWSTIVPITPGGTLPPGVSLNVAENSTGDDLITVTIDRETDPLKFARIRVTGQ